MRGHVTSTKSYKQKVAEGGGARAAWTAAWPSLCRSPGRPRAQGTRPEALRGCSVPGKGLGRQGGHQCCHAAAESQILVSFHGNSDLGPEGMGDRISSGPASRGLLWARTRGPAPSPPPQPRAGAVPPAPKPPDTGFLGQEDHGQAGSSLRRLCPSALGQVVLASWRWEGRPWFRAHHPKGRRLRKKQPACKTFDLLLLPTNNTSILLHTRSPKTLNGLCNLEKQA